MNEETLKSTVRTYATLNKCMIMFYKGGGPVWFLGRPNSQHRWDRTKRWFKFANSLEGAYQLASRMI